MDVATAWENLVQSIAAIERREGDWEVLAATCMAALEMLLEYPPREVLAQIEQSEMPTRATVSWLAFEGAKLGGSNPQRSLALAACWQEANPGRELIAPPPGAAGQPLVLH
ncbi:MAG: hypothetical protein KJ720_18225 [Proteobacteria bacterium]|nr:hypothetical protein [Pseudomonadota bacterium]MBU1451548.1 hypothetical protein [Pseudomonadota bacterium]MBU2468517.1 hypothetical protein [Pseudomonadota bacterium]MBU2518757.1 hypothetical protein [Pseudomonadota bacterium]